MVDRARRIVIQKMESLQRAGVRHVGKRRGASASDPERQLRDLAGNVAQCTLCSELAARRTQTVFGVGNPHARLCFLGEAPGADEDQQGEPFVGRAGQLLDDIIRACGLRRQDVYILNVLKCRPPGNRTPEGDEVANCRHFFERQLEIIQPEFICCLGSVAASALLETNQPVGGLRGRLHQWRGIQVLVTYHPAYLLRYPEKKRDVWNDMQRLMGAMGIKIPSRASRRG
jgi:DNA polymerase